MSIVNAAILAFGLDVGQHCPAYLANPDSFEELIAQEAGLTRPQNLNYTAPEWNEYWTKLNEAVRSYPVEIITYGRLGNYRHLFAVRGTKRIATDHEAVELQSEMYPTKDQLRALRDFCKKHDLHGGVPGWNMVAYRG